MKTGLRCGCLCRWLLAGLVLPFLGAASVSLAQNTRPVITSIRPDGTNVVVVASVPPGIRRVTLESRQRLGSGTWIPAAVAQLDGVAVRVTFRIPCGRGSEMLRVRADAQEPLPSSFYSGTNVFGGQVIDATSPPVLGTGGVVVNDSSSSSVPTSGPSRDVVESDIWRLSGDTLYFFNQYRGLQVIDIADPDHATVRGTLSLPSSGEQMYLPARNRVVLLARDGCAGGGDSEAIVVANSDGVLQVLERLPVPGYIQESRMVGSSLYIASQGYRQAAPVNGVWEWGTLVSAFDLTDPDKPVARGTLWYPGYNNVVAATDTYLFVVTQNPTNWWQSIVRLIDITAPDGTMQGYASLPIKGNIPDKFKLNYADGVLTTISEDLHWTGTRTVMTWLETFSLPDPRAAGPAGIVKLGELELGHGERLHATRFDGDRVYVVTFFQIDPLWVVDLSDPALPRVAGSLDVPGWSTYIMPLGEHLVSVGVETGRVAVSLFDVSTASDPRLLSRVLLGQNYSWSEANNDEKAFSVLTDIGLILVPYSGDTTNGWTSQVQLIDLTETNLVARGMIRHQCEPRRAAWSHHRILSLSGWELLSVDASDRSEPVVRGETPLAWPVDRLLLQGDFVLEIAASTGWWGRPDSSALRVATVDQPAVVLRELTLGTWPVVGAVIREGKLYLAQSQTGPVALPLDSSNGSDTNLPNFSLSIIDLANLPDLTVLGQVSTAVDLPAWSRGLWQPMWPQPDVLVWVGGGQSYWWAPWAVPITTGPILPGGGIAWPIAGVGGGQLLAFDVRQPTAPKFASQVNLATNGWSNFSRPFRADTNVYLSHNATECLSTNRWIRRFYLDVVDYRDPFDPGVRKPVNIPGTLQGLSRAGYLLYTTGYHWDDNNVTDWREWLDACSYDGLSAYLIGSLALPEAWPRPVLALDTNLFVGHSGYSGTNTLPHLLDTWRFTDDGVFVRTGSVVLNAPANIFIERGGLLAAQENDGFVAIFDALVPAALKPVGGDYPAGCAWYDPSLADGNLARGLFIPLGMYGVGHVPANLAEQP